MEIRNNNFSQNKIIKLINFNKKIIQKIDCNEVKHMFNKGNRESKEEQMPIVLITSNF